VTTVVTPPAPPPPRDRFGSTFLIALVLGTAFLFFYMVRVFFVPVLLAAVFATLFHPLYRALLRAFRGRRAAASLVACLVWLVVLLVPRFELDQIDWGAALREGVGTVGGLVATVVSKTSRGTLQVLLTVFVTLFTMFYFFIDGPRIVERIRFLVPLAETYEDAIIARFVSVARASVKGTLLIALVQGAVGGLTLALFGVESAVLWGVVMVVLSVVPVIGAWLVMYPAAIVQLLAGNVWQAVGITLVTVVVIINIDNVLRPRLVGHDAGLHDLLIFFSTLGGIVTFGAMGFIVGPVIAAFFVAVLDAYAQEFQRQLGPRTATAAATAAAEPVGGGPTPGASVP
jgi:predicted PurR-regulated permease PerM